MWISFYFQCSARAFRFVSLPFIFKTCIDTVIRQFLLKWSFTEQNLAVHYIYCSEINTFTYQQVAVTVTPPVIIAQTRRFRFSWVHPTDKLRLVLNRNWSSRLPFLLYWVFFLRVLNALTQKHTLPTVGVFVCVRACRRLKFITVGVFSAGGKP